MRILSVGDGGRVVTLGAYVRAIKTAKANPNTTFSEGLTTWWPTTGQEIMTQFSSGLHDRINQAIPYSQRGFVRASPRPMGRREQPEYQAALHRDARRIQDILQKRIRVYQFETPEARSRFEYLLSHYDD